MTVPWQWWSRKLLCLLMTTIDLCLRVKASGNKGSVLLHILALALKSLEQICYLSVLFLCSCLSPILMQWSCLQWFLSLLSLCTCKLSSFIILFFQLFTHLCASHYPHFIFSQELSVLFFSSSLADSWERISGCSSFKKAAAAPSNSIVPQRLQTPEWSDEWFPEYEKLGKSPIFLSLPL